MDFFNTASFYYDAAEWDGIESVKLEVVARGRRGVKVDVSYTAMLVASGGADQASVSMGFSQFVPYGGQADWFFAASTTSQQGWSTTFYHYWQLTHDAAQGKVTCTLLTTTSYVNWGGIAIGYDVSYSFDVPVGGSASPPNSGDLSNSPDNELYIQFVSASASAVITPTFGLVPATGTTPVVEVTVDSSTPVRVVSGDFKASLVSGTRYVLKVKNADTEAYVYGARLLIQQSNTAAKTVIPFEIGVNFQTTSTTYVVIDPVAYYRHAAANFSGASVTAVFEAEFLISSGQMTATAYCALAQVGGAVVAELSTTSTTSVRVRSAAITLTNNETYEVRLRGSAGWTARVHSARVLVFVNTPSKLTIPRTVLEVVNGVGTTAMRSSDMISWDPVEYSGTALGNAWVEHMIRADWGITVTSRLWDGAATSYSATSASGGHNLYLSATAALPTTAKSYQREAVASGYSSINRVRLARLMVPVVLGAITYDETGKSQVVLIPQFSSGWLILSSINNSQVVRAIGSTKDGISFPETVSQVVVSAAASGNVQKHQESRIQIVKGVSQKTDVGIFIGSHLQLVKGVQTASASCRFFEMGNQTLKALQVSTDSRRMSDVGVQTLRAVGGVGNWQRALEVVGQILKVATIAGDVGFFAESRPGVIRASTAVQDAAVWSEINKNQNLVVVPFGSDARAFSETILQSVSISQLLLGEMYYQKEVLSQILRARIEMYDLSAQRGLYYEGFVDTMNEIDELVAKQLVFGDILSPPLVIGFEASFSGAEVSVAPGKIYGDRMVHYPGSSFTVQATGLPHREYIFVSAQGMRLSSTALAREGEWLIWEVEVNASGQVVSVSDRRPHSLIFLQPLEVSSVHLRAARVNVNVNSEMPPNNSLLVQGDLAVDDHTRGVVLKDSTGRYWRKRVTASGEIVLDDLGTTIP